MKVLGISSCTKYVGVALIKDGVIVSENFSIQKTLSENLVCLIEQLFQNTSYQLKDIELISVVNGPGSYSGIRGGVVAAKTLAQILNVPIVAVSSLDTIAYSFSNAPGTYFVALSARQKEYNVALYGIDKNKINRMGEEFILKEEEIDNFMKKIKGELTVVGLEKDVHPQAGDAALLGRERFLSGEKTETFKIMPHYSYQPNIREFKQAEKQAP